MKWAFSEKADITRYFIPKYREYRMIEYKKLAIGRKEIVEEFDCTITVIQALC